MQRKKEFPASELAMRVLLLLQERSQSDPQFLIADVVDVVMDKFDVSRGTAYRHLHVALKVLEIDYDASHPARQVRLYDRQIASLQEAKRQVRQSIRTQA